jgi:hypothetical protein
MRARPSQVLTIDPRDWIRPPYTRCGRCGASDSVGLLMVSGNVVVRRCRACMHDHRQRLPTPPRPRVLYLDQWALSSLAKARLPETRERFASEEDRAAGAGAWPRLLARIERLVKANLLVCPQSSLHRAESSLDTRLWDALRRLHVYLSGDARFVHHERLKRNQVYAAFCAWLDGVEPSVSERDDVLKLRRGWPDLWQVASSYEPDATEVEVLRAGRKTRSEGLRGEIESWASEQRTFSDRRQEQINAYGSTFLPVGGDLYALTRHALAERSIADENSASRVERFLRSDRPGQTLFAQLASDVLASMGWLAERSQRPKVDRGTITDVQAFAAYAPFCDAFTVDRSFATVLRAPPMEDRRPSETALFASNELGLLENWLVGIEQAAPPGHFKALSGIYGPNWLEPFVGIVDTPGGGENL